MHDEVLERALLVGVAHAPADLARGRVVAQGGEPGAALDGEGVPRGAQAGEVGGGGGRRVGAAHPAAEVAAPGPKHVHERPEDRAEGDLDVGVEHVVGERGDGVEGDGVDPVQIVADAAVVAGLHAAV